jgi:hypothetical protein
MTNQKVLRAHDYTANGLLRANSLNGSGKNRKPRNDFNFGIFDNLRIGMLESIHAHVSLLLEKQYAERKEKALAEAEAILEEAELTVDDLAGFIGRM